MVNGNYFPQCWVELLMFENSLETMKMVSNKDKNNQWLLILAGGFGTRLSKVVNDVPKPLAPVNGKPFLYYLIENWKSQGLHKFCFLVYYRAEQIVDFLKKEQESGILQDCFVEFVFEKFPLGTGGAIVNAIKTQGLSDPFLVVNADTWTEAGVRELTNLSSPAITAVRVSDISRYGAIQIDGNIITKFEEKNQDSGPGYINAGLYFLDPKLFENYGDEVFSLEKDLFGKLVQNKEMYVSKIYSNFIDIGIPQDYYRFCEWISSNKNFEL